MGIKLHLLYVERREKGDYSVRRSESERASAVSKAQKAAIEPARETYPKATPLVEWVRNTTRRSPDKWRKP